MVERKKEVVKKKEVDKKVLSFFMLAFPTILIIILGKLGVQWWVQIFVAFYQFVMLKQFLDNYYEVM